MFTHSKNNYSLKITNENWFVIHTKKNSKIYKGKKPKYKKEMLI